MGYSGAGGKLIHKKTRSKKSRDTVPLILKGFSEKRKPAMKKGSEYPFYNLSFFHPIAPQSLVNKCHIYIYSFSINKTYLW